MIIRLGELAEQVSARLVGDPDCEIYQVASLAEAGPGSISFLSGRRYQRYLTNTKASAVILEGPAAKACPVAALITDNPYLTYAKAAQLLNPPASIDSGAHPSAVISPYARVDSSASIGPLCVIEAGVVIYANIVIGPGCIIAENCSIGESSQLVSKVTLCKNTVIGKRVLIHPGVVLGSDGFGLANDNGVWVKIPQLGRVVIGDDVEIGANTTIDRGTLDDTVIEEGVKLDNQIQVAHNVRIGAHTAVAGCVGIAGSARIGKYCTIGGAAGIQGHLEIGDHVHITGMSKVTKSIREAGVYTSGTPLEPNKKWLKNSVRFKQLDEMARKLKKLENKK